MKRYFFVSGKVLATLCLWLASCSENDGRGSYFMEYTVNGQTYKKTYLDDSEDGWHRSSGEISDVGYHDVDLIHYRYDKDFKSSTLGTYDVVASWQSWANDSDDNLDLRVHFSKDDGTYGARDFELQAGGVNNVTEIKFIKTEDDYACYSVSGNFSCTHKDPATEKIVTTAGKYKLAVWVLL